MIMRKIVNDLKKIWEKYLNGMVEAYGDALKNGATCSFV